jgi:DNA repair exonuclease SbcCD ATPase subunit
MAQSVTQMEWKKDQVHRSIDTLEAKMEKHLEDANALELVHLMFGTLLDEEVNKAKSSLEDITTEALQTVFTDQDLKVEIEVSTKRGKVNAEIVTIRTMPDGSTIQGDVLTNFGGAVATVQSLILRLIVTMKLGLRPVIVLDESLSAVSRAYIIRTARFIRHLCQSMGARVLIVTHDPMLVAEADQAYELSLVGNSASIQSLR